MKQDAKKYPLTPRPVQPVASPISQGKIILAVVLIGVMGFMWIRVYWRHGKPAAVSAQPAASKAPQKVPAVKSAPTARLSYSPLVTVSGRHDRLARDLFSAPDTAVFPWQQAAQPIPPLESQNAVTPFEDPWDKKIRPLVERMTVDAIGTDPKGTAQAFIQDRFLVSGDTLSVQLGQQQYELKIKEIHSNAVVLEWQEHTVTLKMAEPGMSGDK
ncbi:MAG: hypothetical protein GX455_05850 [Phycisphaerae bacterium]|nr:hypothetical protein [Phycisphaerae bacterium]